MELDPIVFWRMMNILLGIVTLVVLTVDGYERRYKLSSRRLYLTIALAVYIISTIVGSAEAIYHGEPLRIRTGLYTAADVLTLIGLWISRDDPT